MTRFAGSAVLEAKACIKDYMFKFIKEQDSTNKFDNTRIEVQCDAVTLPEIVEAFQYFLKGCGFEFKGTLDIVDEE